MTPSLMLSQASGVPFWRQIRDQLADRIRSGALPAGTPLPSVRTLAAELAVSVITTKKAYDELVNDGLADARQGRGTFVADDAASASRAALTADLARELDAWVGRARAAELGADEIRALLDAAGRADHR
ncbi:MAG: GntR family transcriptional regulator [Myxococcota bacterium]